MLLFTIVVRHPKTSNNYVHVCTLLKRTIRSVCQQQNAEFLLVVACSEKPDFDIDDERVIFKTIDCSIPKTRHEMLMDKSVKRLVAFQEGLRRTKFSYLMMLDADDLVSKNLASFILSSLPDGASGARLNAGYLLDFNNQRLQKKYGFNHYCGSSLIYNINDVISMLGVSKKAFMALNTQAEFLEACDNYVMKEMLGDHRHPNHFFKSKKRPLVQIYEPLACWVVNNGENLSKTTIGRGARTMNSAMLEEFALTKEMKPVAPSILDQLIEQGRFLKSVFGHYYRTLTKRY
ncbi:glycosyltransferase family A protein [Ningiella sp. W23]|uniref:glycosyltransferase family A protein n=1 Tax=Ningiella sp. W23 TaxID=3023715 RepID=UPI00375691D2